MKLNNRSILLVIAFAFLCITLGCNNSAMNSVPGEIGTLILLISNNDEDSRTITPNVSTEIVTYDISGIGPEGEKFETLNIMGDSTFEMNLHPGMWSITVYGKNADRVIIASAVKEIYISSDKITNEDIHLSPLAGSGNISYKLSWDELSISSPIINAKLINQSKKNEVEVDVVLSDDKKSLLIERQLESGYYTLSVQLFDGEALIWGNIDSVRILANQSTYYDESVE